MGLQENFRNEQISQLAIREPITVQSTSSVSDTVSLMRDRDLGCAFVVDDAGKLIGVFTESMLTELLSHGHVELDEPIENRMAKRCAWVTKTDPIVDILDAMQMKNLRFLCVVDEQGRVVGLTGQRGLMEYVADSFPGQVLVRKIGQSPYLSEREGA